MTNAISNKDQRGVKPLDFALGEIKKINTTYFAGTESILNLKPTREELLKENEKLRQKNVLLKAQLRKFGEIFDGFANKKLSNEINNEVDAERGREVE